MRRKLRFWLSNVAILGFVFLLAGCSGSKPAAYNPNKDLGPQINYTITGMDASSGIMDSTDKAIDVYGLKAKNWQLMPSSTASMLSTVDKAVKYKQPIVIPAYQPHWMFYEYPLKFLKDPKNVFGQGEHESTIARFGLKKDNPGAYKFLQNFHWTLKEAAPVMMNIHHGMSAKKAAKKFVKNNPKKVNQLLAGVPDGHGKKISLAYMPYDYEYAANAVVRQLLKDKGYDATIQQLDVGVMWQAVVSKKVDATITAELPATHAAFAKKYKGQYDLVRTNLKGARIGLAVPKYMKNINSIEDLKGSNN
ncbi:glycine betaine ABC transporter substrate-binding protein [Loigolactobacillus rennini]|uniref:Glycine betaine carnitine ABC transporter, substrate-binding lipoprotein(ProX) n=1 Tax=Loigolactobacillus rennini DSM 20253 TaxID=1423796 RepID=A0A0R2D2P2_9LACO|nr:glycine betaine ABC transporter substrate-binding protein [Loigolactobacillus rennini]KRM94809.1 glycine betaine carnitine ABC transporter, substrate-binding lipoprotein precursor(ProX) [Loigolactobacillus rennini DSM 20253]